MDRSGRALLVVAAVAAALVVPGAASAEAAGCGTGSWIAGTVDVCDGVAVYRDYVYDDYGADTGELGAVSTGTLSNPTGDRRYAVDPGANSADLVSLSLARDGESVSVIAVLNSPTRDGAVTTLALAVDTDGNGTTGGGEWSPLAVSSAGWDELYVFTTAGDGEDEITGSFPLPDVPAWRIQAVTATTDGTVMNVAFRLTDENGASETGPWFEDRQAETLAGGDISPFGLTVATADLDPWVTRRAEVPPGFYERVYVSDFCIPNGVKCDGIDYVGVDGPAPPAQSFG